MHQSEGKNNTWQIPLINTQLVDFQFTTKTSFVPLQNKLFLRQDGKQ